MFFPTLLPGRARTSKPSSRQWRRASSQRTGTFRPQLETLEDRTVLSTIAYQVPAGTVGTQTNFSGPLGMDFDVNQQPIAITELGVFDNGSDGLANALTARLYNRDTQLEVAHLDFAAGQTGTLIDGSRFLPLATPVVLPAGFHGSIVAEGYSPAEPDGNFLSQPITWSTNGGGLINFVGTSRYGFTQGDFPTTPDAGPANRYAAGTFQFMPLSQIATGAATAVAGSPYTLNLNLTQATGITSWTINWGDGNIDTLPGNPSQATHVYLAGGTFAIAVTANDGTPSAFGTSHRDVVLSDAPAAYWRLDETSPPTAQDEVGGHNATYQNFSAADLVQPGALSSDTSTSALFNGVDHYVSLPDVFNFPTSGTTSQYAVSFGAWFRTTSSGVILGQTDGSGSPGGDAPGGYVPAVYVGTDGHVNASLFWHGASTTLSSLLIYNDGNWHQVVDVYDHGVETLYLDGNAVAAQAVGPAVAYASGYVYTLGVGYSKTPDWPDTNTGWSFFNGQLDEVAVYQGALSAQQVAAQYLAGTTPRVPVTVTVLNATPTASLQGPADGVRGQARTFTFAATSPSASEQAAGFTYTINWGDNSPVQTIARTAGNATGVSVSHVFTDSGTYTVTVTATDQDGHASAPASQSITITPYSIQTQPDPLNPNSTIQVLVVGGTTGTDQIHIALGPGGVGIKVTIEELDLGQEITQVFTDPIDRIVVYGQGGNDEIIVSPRITVPTELYAGTGNALLAGGGGANLLVGGAGNNVLIGGRGRNLMIGGAGNDLLIGDDGGDILIGGQTDYDSNEAALRALLAEWTSGDSYETRVAHLFGTLAGGLNGSYQLNASTVHDDGARDVLWGDEGRDWFLVSKLDWILDRCPNETVTQV
jgi:hypothetical protein